MTKTLRPLFGIGIALLALGVAFPAEARTVQQFLADCSTAQQVDDDACSYLLLSAEVDAHADDTANKCDIPAPEQELPAIVAWLRANDQVHPDDAEAAATQALETLYCR